MSPANYLRSHLDGSAVASNALQALTVRISYENFARLKLLANHIDKARTRVASQVLECAIEEMWLELANHDPELVFEFDGQVEAFVEEMLLEHHDATGEAA